MNIFKRIWLSVFGPYIGMKTENTEFILQRGYWGELLLTTTTKVDGTYNDKFGIQIKLSGSQADELYKWLHITRGSVNKPLKNNMIRLVPPEK